MGCLCAAVIHLHRWRLNPAGATAGAKLQINHQVRHLIPHLGFAKQIARGNILEQPLSNRTTAACVFAERLGSRGGAESNMVKTVYRLGACIVVSLLLASSAWSWGAVGHRLVVHLAVSNLPPDMPRFFTKAAAELEFLSPEPDAWGDRAEQQLSTALVNGQDRDHIFKFELYAPDKLPPDRYTFIETLTREGKSVRLVGMLPYRSMELFQRMRVSWRRWRQAKDKETRRFLEARIIQDGGLLGHYIADAADPNHMSVNRNGWELPENPRGYTQDNTLHRRFESEFVTAHILPRQVQTLVRKTTIVDDGLSYIYAHMRRSYDRIVDLYELEKQQPFGSGKASPEAVDFVATRLADAASTLRDLWYTAYVTSAVSETSR